MRQENQFKKYSQYLKLQNFSNFNNFVQLFYCHECKKEFSRPDALKAHQRYHFAPFKFACKTCDKKFQVQADYQNHIKRGDCLAGTQALVTPNNQHQPVQDKLKDSKRKPRKVNIFIYI